MELFRKSERRDACSGSGCHFLLLLVLLLQLFGGLSRYVLAVEYLVLLEQTYHANKIRTITTLEITIAESMLQQMLLQVAVVVRLVGTRLTVEHFFLVRHRCGRTRAAVENVWECRTQTRVCIRRTGTRTGTVRDEISCLELDTVIVGEHNRLGRFRYIRHVLFANAIARIRICVVRFNMILLTMVVVIIIVVVVVVIVVVVVDGCWNWFASGCSVVFRVVMVVVVVVFIVAIVIVVVVDICVDFVVLGIVEVSWHGFFGNLFGLDLESWWLLLFLRF